MYTINENDGIARVRVIIYLKERKLAPLEPKLGYQRSKMGLHAHQSPVYKPGTNHHKDQAGAYWFAASCSLM